MALKRNWLPLAFQQEGLRNGGVRGNEFSDELWGARKVGKKIKLNGKLLCRSVEKEGASSFACSSNGWKMYEKRGNAWKIDTGLQYSPWQEKKVTREVKR